MKHLIKALFFITFLSFCLKTSAQTEQTLAQGIVTDKNKEPLPGVAITIEGTNARTITNLKGQFKLKATAGSRIRFTSVGFESYEVVWNGKSEIRVILANNEKLLDEVVIVGAYGTAQKRSDMVGSAFQINAEKIESLPANRLDNLLQGMIPGLTIAPNTDGASSTKARLNLRVRGEGSLSASNEPLWIIDGNIVYTGDRTNMIPGIETSVSPLSYLNPDDIESITVLKDAVSTSIYGANGSNGVILVTTKKGKGRTSTRLTLQSGITTIDKSTKFKVLNATEYLTLAKEAYQNLGMNMKFFPFQDNPMNAYSTTNTDWTDVYYNRGSYNQANLSLSGSSPQVNYFISGSFLNSQSTLKGNDQSRFSIRNNIDLAMNKKLSLQFVGFSSYNINNIFNPGNDYIQMLPIFSPYYTDGTLRLYNTYAEQDENSITWTSKRFLNSVARREQNDDVQKTFATNQQLRLTLKILKGLVSTSQLGADYQSVNQDRYQASTNWSGMDLSTGKPLGNSNRNNSSTFSWQALQRFNFDRKFGKHTLGAVLGMEATSETVKTIGATGSGFFNDKTKEVSYAIDKRGASSERTVRKVSLFEQMSYSFDSRYYLTVNARSDGHSDFGTDVRWAQFASIGGSWNIHNEAFFHFPIINTLKLKASFGSNGNSRLGSGALEALGTYSYNSQYIDSPGGTMSGSRNRKLTWETAYMTNLGVRIGIFDRIDLDVEVYNKKTVNLLNKIDVTRTIGNTRMYRNIGEMLNRGIEVTLDALIIHNTDWRWNMTLNAAHNSNKLLRLYNNIQKTNGNYILSPGYDTGTFYIVRWAGVDPRDGAPLWYDSEGNVTRVYSDSYRVPWHTKNPWFSGGVSSDVAYKNLSLRIHCSYVLGGYAFSTFARSIMSDGKNILDENQSINQLDRWQKPGNIALTPRIVYLNPTRSVMSSTRHIYKTTHVKLNNVTLNYQLPRTWIQSLGLTTFRISLIGDNLLVWTPYAKKSRNSYKQSMSGYPSERTVSLAFNLSF